MTARSMECCAKRVMKFCDGPVLFSGVSSAEEPTKEVVQKRKQEIQENNKAIEKMRFGKNVQHSAIVQVRCGQNTEQDVFTDKHIFLTCVAQGLLAQDSRV